MSLVINTNSIATVTRNYLNSNQANLKTSLSRLASGSRIVNPSDDAGGLAVGNKLAATLNRNTRAQQNVQNSISFLQVQDGALTQVGKILDRMSELKTMSLDVTKNASDIANYDAEFNQLQDQLSNIKEEKFNGINLFTSGASGPSALTTYTTETGDGVVSTSVKQVDTITNINGNDTVDADVFSISMGGVAGSATVAYATDAATTAAALVAQINTDFGAAGGLSQEVLATVDGDNVKVTALAAGTSFSFAITATDGAGGSTATAAVNSSTTTKIHTSVDLTRLNIFQAGSDGNGLITAGVAATANDGLDLLDSATATTNNLADYTVDDFVTFIQNGATARANNGAEMSRLEASHALLTTNHANLESARSRLMDVDIAVESTHFAKHNILVQSSAAMLSQANSLPNIALQLLG
jgi:flagellin